ncbi:hypothetical protein X971_3583 [Agrobacterium tumefaciens LBA4213 (Ach5)]|nr:hypothetical protein X971_3583 [Agrobacterium tumefaciens LBA4213 (Ach5)]
MGSQLYFVQRTSPPFGSRRHTDFAQYNFHRPDHRASATFGFPERHRCLKNPSS